MLASLKENIQKLKLISSKSLNSLIFYGVGIGILSFLIESTFIFVIQGFFRELNFLDKANLFIPDTYPSGILLNFIILLVFIWFRFFVNTYRHYLTEKLGFLTIYDIRKDIYEKVYNSKIEISSDIIIGIFTENTFRIGGLFSSLFIAISFFVSLVFYTVFLLIISPTELIILFLSGALIYPILVLIIKKIKLKTISLYEQLKYVNSNLVQGLKNKEYILSMSLENEKIDDAEKGLDEYLGTSNSYNFLLSIKGYIPLLFGSTILIIVIYISHVNQISKIGVLFTFFYLFVRLLQNISDLIKVFSKIYLNLPAIDEVIRIKNFKKKKTKTVLEEEIIEIKAKDVYVKDRLKALSFESKKGDLILIKGRSGCGKTTLSFIILGLMEQDEGLLGINSTDHRNLDYGEKISYVSSEKFLKNGSLKSNLSYVKPDFSYERVKEYFNILEIGYLLKDFETRDVIDDKNFSVGEIARFNLVRALVRDPELLVMDEVTSGLDMKSSMALKSCILKEKSKRITFVISHDDIFDDIADKVINLDE